MFGRRVKVTAFYSFNCKIKIDIKDIFNFQNKTIHSLTVNI